MKKQTTFLVVFLLISVTKLLAQPGFDDDVQDAPLGGIEFLVGAGLAYGLKMKKKLGNILNEDLN